MKLIVILPLLVLFCLSCKNNKKEQLEQERFDKVKWATMDEVDYPYRDKMLKDLMTNYKLHGLKKDEVLQLLGSPERTDGLYLFYPIAQQRLGSFPIHTKTLVIKLTKDSTVEWRKIHE